MEVSSSEDHNWIPLVYLCPFVYATAFGRLKSFSSVVFLLGCMTYFQMIYHTASCTMMRHHLLLFKQLYFMLAATSCWVLWPTKFWRFWKKSISVVWVLLLYIRLNWLWFVDCLGILIMVDELQEKKKKQQHTKYSGNIRTERSRPRRDFFDHNEFRVVHSDWINKKPRFEIYNSEYSNASKEQLQIQH